MESIKLAVISRYLAVDLAIPDQDPMDSLPPAGLCHIFTREERAGGVLQPLLFLFQSPLLIFPPLHLLPIPPQQKNREIRISMHSSTAWCNPFFLEAPPSIVRPLSYKRGRDTIYNAGMRRKTRKGEKEAASSGVPIT